MGYKARVGTEDFRKNWQQDVYTFSLSKQAMRYNWGEEVWNAERKDEEINYSERIYKEDLKIIHRKTMLMMIMNMMIVMTMIDGEDRLCCFGC
jgi:hypothetical protein